MFALTDVILQRAEAYRFGLSRQGQRGPPGGEASWSNAVGQTPTVECVG